MKYGVFTSVYGKYEVEEAAKRIHEAGFKAVQLVPVSGGKWLSAKEFTPEYIARTRNAYTKYGIEIVAVSAGHSFVPPDATKREQALADALRWIEIAPELGAKLVVTEIGSTHPSHNWTDYPDNHTADTWGEVVKIYKTLAKHAREYGVTVGIESHFAAVIKGPKGLQKILASVKEENVKVVLDPANSVTAENAGQQEAELGKFFELIGGDIVLAHAKDTKTDSGESLFVPAGQGVLPYSKYISKLKENGYNGPLILEYLTEDEVPKTLAFLKRQEVPPYLLPLYDGDERFYGAVDSVQNLVHAREGALELKYRLLLSVVADALQNHPAGAVACAKEAIAAGATPEQVAEAMRVVYAAGGLPLVIENIDVYREAILK